MKYASFINNTQLKKIGDAASCFSSQFAESFLTLIIQQQLHSLNMLYVECMQQLIMQHPHYCLLGNMMSHSPCTSIRGWFYGMQNVFHIGASTTPWFATIHHIRMLMTCFSQMSQRNECPAFCMLSLQIPFSVHTCSGCNYVLVLQAVTSYLSVCCLERLFSVCHNLEVIFTAVSLNTIALVCSHVH